MGRGSSNLPKGNKTDLERKEFECSEDGVVQAAEWLSEISAKYGF